MKKLQQCAALLFALLLLLSLPVLAVADDTVYSHGYLLYRVEDGGITIVGYVGDEEETVVIPNAIAGYPVSRIASGAFDDAELVKTIYLPDTIMEIEAGAIPGVIAVVRDYNLNTEVVIDPATGSVDPASLPSPSQPVGEVIYSDEQAGITIIDETYLNPVDETEFIEEDPTPMPTPEATETPEPTEEPTATPEPTPETETPTAETSGGAIGWIIGAAVLVCGGAAVIVVRKKDGKA